MNNNKDTKKELKLKNVPDSLYKLLILLVIITIIAIFVIFIFMAYNRKLQRESENIPSESDSFKTEVEEYREQQQSVYQESINDLKEHTVYHTDGTVTYFDDFMESDYPDMTLDKYIEYSYDNGDILQCNFVGSNLYVLLIYALNQVNINNSFNDTYTCNTPDDVQEIKTAMIFQCTAHGSDGHTITATIDCSNIKVRIDSVE